MTRLNPIDGSSDLAMSEILAIRVQRLTRILCGVLVALIVAGDQFTKALVAGSIPEHAVIPLIPGVLNLTHVRNAGIAFGLFSDSPAPWKTALLVAVSGVLLAAIVVMIWRTRQLPWESGVGLSLMLGGALSNQIDRVRWGGVIDFVDVYVSSYHWPSFNLADSAIVVGAFCLVIHLFRSE